MDDYYVNYMEKLKNEVKHINNIEVIHSFNIDFTSEITQLKNLLGSFLVQLTGYEIEIRRLIDEILSAGYFNDISNIPELLEKLYIICLEYLTKYKTDRNKKIEGLITIISTSHTKDELKQLTNLIHIEQHNSEISQIYKFFKIIYLKYITYKYINMPSQIELIKEFYITDDENIANIIEMYAEKKFKMGELNEIEREKKGKKRKQLIKDVYNMDGKNIAEIIEKYAEQKFNMGELNEIEREKEKRRKQLIKNLNLEITISKSQKSSNKPKSV